MRLTIDEYAKKYKMSKQMISSKLKTKKLNYIIENNTTYIIENQTVKQQTGQIKYPPAKPQKRITVATVLALYQRENRQLKEKIVQLENKIDKLINDKEQMLRAERDKIEEVYSAKDEQLKKILELISTKLSLENQATEIHEVQTYQKLEQQAQENELVELKDYLETLDLKSSQKKIIKKRFLNVHDSDIRIIQQNGKLYLDFSKYDYTDLLAF
jgi:hypothetical protein